MRAFRLALYFVLGLLLSAAVTLSYAAAYTSASGKGFKPTGAAGGGTWNGNGSVSGGTAQTIETVNIGGKYISVPQAGALGAAALEMGIAVMRTSGAGIAASVGIYALSKGLEYVNGQWMSQGEPVPLSPVASGAASCDMGQITSCSYSAVCSMGGNSIRAINNPAKGAPWQSINACGAIGTVQFYPKSSPAISPCPSNYTSRDGSCWPNDWVPAGESDWDRVRGVTPPDQVWADIARQAAALGMPLPIVPGTTPTVTVPLSEWETSPANPNQQTRQVANVNPAPTPEDPFRVSVSTETQTKTAGTDPNTGQPTETTESQKDENPDFCVLHPDSVACADLGEPEDVDFDSLEKTVTISPQSGWGPDVGTCPQPLTYTIHGGRVLSFSYAPVCQAAGMFKPAVIGMAWLSALFIFFGVTRKAS